MVDKIAEHMKLVHAHSLAFANVCQADEATVRQCIEEKDAAQQAIEASARALAQVPEQVAYTYASTQATNCAECGERKHTPLRVDAMGGYVCLTCIDRKLGTPQGVQPCGHPDTLLLKSAETGVPMYCEACDDKSGRRDAETREAELMAELADLKKRDKHRAEITSEEWEWLKHPQSANDLADFVYEFAARNVVAQVPEQVAGDSKLNQGIVDYCEIADCECGDRPADWCSVCPKLRAARTSGEANHG